MLDYLDLLQITLKPEELNFLEIIKKKLEKGAVILRRKFEYYLENMDPQIILTSHIDHIIKMMRDDLTINV